LAAGLQASLQIIIMLSGNFTFFNILTMNLAIVLVDDDFFACIRRLAYKTKDGHLVSQLPVVQSSTGQETQPLLDPASQVARGLSTSDSISSSTLTLPASATADSVHHGRPKIPEWVLTCQTWCSGFALGTSLIFLLVSAHWFGLYTQQVALHKDDLVSIITKVLPPLLTIMLVIVALSSVVDVARSLSDSPVNCGWLGKLGTSTLAVFRGYICCFLLLANARPLVEICPSLTTWTHAQHYLPFGVQSHVYGYGLFRSMTGVGQDGQVARPEVILEVLGATSKRWHELAFRYKPGRVDKVPPIIAPYQPRLDWQMWFQALQGVECASGPQSFCSTWFDALGNAILEGRPAVLQLLDTNSFPSEPISSVRVKLYEYHFTDWSGSRTQWWSRKLIQSSEGQAVPQSAGGSVPLIADESYLDLRAFLVKLSCALVAVGAVRATVPPGAWSLEADTFKLSPSPALGVASANLVAILVIMFWSVPRNWSHALVVTILALCICGVASQRLLVQAQNQYHDDTAEQDGVAPRRRSPRCSTGRYWVCALSAPVAVYAQLYSAWLLFSTVVFFGFITAVWRCVGYFQESMPPVLAAVTFIDIGFAVVLMIANGYWEQ